MNKTALKNFSVWARNKLIEDITYRAGLVGVSASGIASPLPQSTNDLQFYDIGTKEYAQVSGDAIGQRDAVAVVEEIAYTWFNRLVAIRFMEVNDYLPSRIRVLSSENPAKNEPDLVTTPFDGDLEFTISEQDKIMRLKDENKLDELFRFLFVKQCNKLYEILPVMFEKTSDYTELLLSISFTDKDGFVYRLTHIDGITDADWQDQVQIIGWLYQYYNTELKDETFALLKKNVKITKERVPAATQLFTPDWIVRYMVENSLGRLWMEGHPNNELKTNWKYYLEEAEQEPAVQAQLSEIRKEYASLSPEHIKVIDPCMGSGHILVYLFDVLMQIYESQGYTQRDAARLILEKNLYGLDIDTRAAQLAYFAVLMKARQYDRRILTRGIQPHVFAIAESNGFNIAQLRYFGAGLNDLEKKNAQNHVKSLLDDLHDAKEYGSILNIEGYDWNLLRRFAGSADVVGQMSLDSIGIDDTQKKLIELINTGEALSQKYMTCVTNPPYMGGTGMDDKLITFIKNKYDNSKTDLYSVFIERCIEFSHKNAFTAMITQHGWMFLSSFEKMRGDCLNSSVVNMAHLGPRAFDEIGGEVVQSATFVLRKTTCNAYTAAYVRLVSYPSENGKEKGFLNKKNIFYSNQSNFLRIPGKPYAYWSSEAIISAFSKAEPLSSIAEPRQGVKTLNNDLFLKLWFEVASENVEYNCSSIEESVSTGKKWFPYNKGGSFRKWYGNNDYLVNWENDGHDMKKLAVEKYHSVTRTITNISYFFLPGLTWSSLSSGNISLRAFDKGFIFDSKGSSMFFADRAIEKYVLALVNSKVSMKFLEFLAPTLDFNIGPLSKIPVLIDKRCAPTIDNIVDDCILLATNDWDAYENSWDFTSHPFIRWGKELWDATGIGATMQKYYGRHPEVSCPLKLCYMLWQGECEERFNQLKANEEELNRIFIDIYGLQDELTPDVEDKDVTVRKADLTRDIKSFISYAVGCMFGRYSLSQDGLAYAGGEWDDKKYSSFQPDHDNCIPITDEPYFEDDVVSRFCEFLRVVYGEECLEDNLDYIAKALGNKGATSREIIWNYFLNDFMKDHLKTYQKRPIYWLFDSGKQNGFKALVYMHRWDADTVGNLRVEYLHKTQHVYEREIQRMQDTIDEGRDSREVSKATKRKDKLQKQLKETKDYDAMLAHIALSRIEIDLDDGVKVNYEKVQTARDGKKMQILAKI